MSLVIADSKNQESRSYGTTCLERLDPISTSSSAKQDCHLCTLILDSFRQDPSTQLPPQSRIKGVRLFISWLNRLRIRVDYWNNLERLHLAFPNSPSCDLKIIHHMEHSIIDEEGTLPSVLPTRIGTSTSLGEAFQLASVWLRQCLTSHSCSPQGVSKRILPTRLMKIEDLGTRIVPRVILSQGLGDDVDYTTLSHCWGTRPTLTLTSKTSSRMQEGLDMEVVPKTFRDAILITHRLGFQYIWIDSLCILQDSPEDWAKESITMVNVYRNSACTIAALRAKDSYQGCFSTRSSLHHYPCRLTTGTEESIHVRMEPWRYLDDLFDRDTIRNQTTLLGRGWVVQERLLSPRILYYGTTLLFWECDELFASEINPLGEKSTTTLLKLPKQSFQLLLGSSSLGASWNLGLFLSFWKIVLDEYSHCSLTIAEDRLPAISGIIQAISNATGFHNIAGLWREGLRDELLWHTTGVPDPRPNSYMAPSWSWASITSGVSGCLSGSDTPGLEWKVDIHGAAVKHANDNGTGPILGGVIVLSGSLYKVNGSLDPQGRPVISVYKKSVHSDEYLWWNPDAPIDASLELWFLEFNIFRHSDFTAYEGLIVVPVDTSSLEQQDNVSVWRRVGHFRDLSKPQHRGKIIKRQRITLI